MKKLFSILSIAAISFAAITSCAKEEQASVAEEGINITVIASDKDVDNDPSKTKTYVSEDTEKQEVHVYWQDVETEKLMVYELIDNGNTAIRYNESSKADIKDGGVTAEFQTSIYGETPTGEHTYKYTAIYPSSCASPSSGKYRVEIPQVQTLNGINLAPNADVLVGIPYDNGNTRITDGAKIDYQFNRFGTTVKMTLKGINEGETVSKVEITAPRGISGFGVVDLTTGGINVITGPKTTMTLNLNQVVDETTNISVWFRVLSGTWTVSNDKPLKVVVTTDEATYTKEITAIASLQNKLEFAEGGLTAFGISGMTRDENSVIEDGDYVITAVNESTNYIMLAYESGNNIKSETYTLNDEGNFVFNSSSTHDPEECVYTFTRVTEEGDFKGCYTIKDCNGNYLYAAGVNSGDKKQNYLKASNPDTKDNTYYWSITYVNEEYSITAKSENSNQLKFNSATNQLMFSCYISGQTAITLYPASKLVIDRTPRIEVSANELNYAADGTTEDDQITVKAKYCEGLSAISNDGWISGISISEGVLALTVSTNTATQERQGTIIISSTTSGVETKSIAIKQAAHSDQPQGGEGTINFGNGEGDCAINSASVNGTDTNGQKWTITTSGTNYYGQNANYSQIGSSGNPADGITFTTTLPNDAQITDFSAKFGGFSETAGTVKLKVGETEVGSGSLSASTDVTVNINDNKKGTVGKVLTVTVTGISKGVKAYYISYAYEPNKTVESIAVKTAPTTTTYYVGDTFDPAGLVITATYDDASTEDIAYVGNESKFTFDPALNVALQTSNKSVSITYGEKSTTQAITVSTVPVTGVSLSETTKEIYVNNEFKLTPTIAPTNATNKNVSWKSSAAGVATVDANGNVKGIGVGTATITVSTEDGSKTATCAVTVKAAPSLMFNVTPTSPIEIGAGEYDEAPIAIEASEGVAWTVTLTKGDESAIAFAESGTGSVSEYEVMIGANTGAARTFVLHFATEAEVAQKTYDVTINQAAGIVDATYTMQMSEIGTSTSYGTYSNDDWKITCGSSNGSFGSNSNNAESKMKLGDDYVVALPLDGTVTSDTKFFAAGISKKKLDNITKVILSGTPKSGMTVGLVYSTDGTNWIKLKALETASSSGTTWTFTRIASAYYAVVIKAANKSNATYASFKAEFKTK